MKPIFHFSILAALLITAAAHPNHQVASGTVRGATDPEMESQIVHLQDRIAKEQSNPALLENLAWLLIAKARFASNPSVYDAAIECANKLSEIEGSSAQADLLLGHLYLQQHRFQEAKACALKLVQERGWHYDQGLLGDVLLDLGDTKGALSAYQAMMSQRPGLESYARAGLIRWQRGRLDGAIEAMELAVSAGSRRSPEPLAWAYTKLAGYRLQKGDYPGAIVACEEALGLVNRYPQALLIQGRTLMAQGAFDQAIEPLKTAVMLVPEPTYLWALGDCYKTLGKAEEAANVEKQLYDTGAAIDPRTYALFLATKGVRTVEAVSLAVAELNERQDVFTHDALAWALSANGNHARAAKYMDRALAEGTHDARLSLHAGIITARSGDTAKAAKHFSQASEYRSQLLPSELQLLQENLKAVVLSK